MKMYKNRDFCAARKIHQTRKCVSRGGPVRVPACSTLWEIKIVKIQLRLQSRLSGTRRHVRQVIGIIILSRACNGHKIHLQIHASKMCAALKENQQPFWDHAIPIRRVTENRLHVARRKVSKQVFALESNLEFFPLWGK